jgi:hypothetical protein
VARGFTPEAWAGGVVRLAERASGVRQRNRGIS